MKQTIIDGLYIFVMVSVFILAIYSIFSPQETSMIEDVALVIFAAVISIATLCCVIFDKEEDKDDSDQGDGDDFN